jgi:hypothetical protein
MDPLEFFRREWRVIRDAPMTFGIAAILIALGGYYVARLQADDRIATLEERLKLRDDQIAELRAKEGGISPADEAQAGIDVADPREIVLTRKSAGTVYKGENGVLVIGGMIPLPGTGAGQTTDESVVRLHDLAQAAKRF